MKADIWKVMKKISRGYRNKKNWYKYAGVLVMVLVICTLFAVSSSALPLESDQTADSIAVNEDLTHLFEKNKYDTLLIWGDKDDATPLSDAKIMEKLMPNAGLAVIPGTGHFSFAENVPMFTGIIKANFDLN